MQKKKENVDAENKKIFHGSSRESIRRLLDGENDRKKLRAREML